MEFLQDDSFSDALSEDLQSCGTGWEVITNVSSASGPSIPGCKGIYLFVWRPYFTLPVDGTEISFRYVVYVGSASSGSSDIAKRFISDYRDKINKDQAVHWTSSNPTDRASRLNKVLNLGQLDYWYMAMDDATSEQICDIEKRLINMFNPPGNKNFKSPIRVVIDRKNVAPAFEPAF